MSGRRSVRVRALWLSVAVSLAASWLAIDDIRHALLIAPPAAPPPQVKAIRVPPLTGAVGLSPHAAALARYIQATYPGVSSIGGVRADPIPDHPSGHALDIMVGSNAMLGDRIEADLMSRASQLSIRYLIWQETYRNPSGVATFMADRGSRTANHYDHIHVTVNG